MKIVIYLGRIRLVLDFWFVLFFVGIDCNAVCDI